MHCFIKGMDKIRIKDKTFKPYISSDEIARAVVRVACCIREDVKDERPLFIVMLNGAFVFASDLLREMEFPCEVAFMRMKSYAGTVTTGKVDLLQDIGVDDIVDTGTTMHALLQNLQARSPKCIKIAALLFKPESLLYDFKVDYVAFEIPRDFIVGYGLDYEEEGRNLKDIYVIDN